MSFAFDCIKKDGIQYSVPPKIWNLFFYRELEMIRPREPLTARTLNEHYLPGTRRVVPAILKYTSVKTMRFTPFPQKTEVVYVVLYYDYVRGFPAWILAEGSASAEAESVNCESTAANA